MAYDRSSLRRSVRQSKNQGGMADIIDAFTEGQMARQEAKFKVQQANAKVKSELLKAMIMKKMGEKERIAANPKHPQNPQQDYLRRRAAEEDPIGSLMIPTEEGQDTVEFPADEIVRDRGGAYETKPLSEDRKNQFFLAKLERMIEANKNGKGPAPSALAMKIGEKMKARMNKKLGLSSGPNRQTQAILDDLSEAVAQGKIKTSREAIEALNKQEGAGELAGADMKYIYEQIQKTLPSVVVPEKKQKSFLGLKFGKSNPEYRMKDGEWYEKVQGGWQLADEKKAKRAMNG